MSLDPSEFVRNGGRLPSDIHGNLLPIQRSIDFSEFQNQQPKTYTYRWIRRIKTPLSFASISGLINYISSITLGKFVFPELYRFCMQHTVRFAVFEPSIMNCAILSGGAAAIFVGMMYEAGMKGYADSVIEGGNETALSSLEKNGIIEEIK